MCTGRTRGLGVHLLSTGSASTGKDQGNGIPGEKGLVIAGHLNQDQGGLPRGLHLENPAGDHARKVQDHQADCSKSLLLHNNADCCTTMIARAIKLILAPGAHQR